MGPTEVRHLSPIAWPTVARSTMLLGVLTLLLLAAACHRQVQPHCLPFAFSTERFDVHAEEDTPGLREVARWAEAALEAAESVLGPFPKGVRPELLPFPESCAPTAHHGSGQSAVHGLFQPGRPPRMFLTWGGCPLEVRGMLVHELTHWYASEAAPRAPGWLVEAASEWLERELASDESEEDAAHEKERQGALLESRHLAAAGKRPEGAAANAWFAAYALFERVTLEDGTVGERLGELLRAPEDKLDNIYRDYLKALGSDLWKDGTPRRFLK